MKPLLTEKKLWGYVTESTKLKVDPSEKDIENHEHKLQCAYTKFTMSLSTSCVALCQAYGQCSRSNLTKRPDWQSCGSNVNT